MLEACLDGVRVREIETDTQRDFDLLLRMSYEASTLAIYFERTRSPERYWEIIFSDHHRSRGMLLNRDPRRYGFVVEQGGVPCGFFSLDVSCNLGIESRYAAVSYFIAEAHRRKKVGLRALKAVCSLAFERFGAMYVLAECVKENKASSGLLVCAGFKHVGDFKSESGRHFIHSLYSLSKKDFVFS